MAKFLSILILILILIVVVLWFWLVGWAVGILLSLFGISIAHGWWALITVGLATCIVGSCIGEQVTKDND